MKRIVILSGKGGTGKTTTAAAFLHFSQAKAVADCDVDAPNLHLLRAERGAGERSDFLGGEKAQIDREKCIACGTCLRHCRFEAISCKAGRYTVNEYACEGCGVCALVCPRDAVRLCSDVAGEKTLFKENGVLSTASLKMGRGNSGKLVSEVKLAMLKHAPETELAIVDGAPGIGCPVIASMGGMDLILAVAEPSLSGCSDLQRLWETAKQFQMKMAVCVNKWDVSPLHTEQIRSFCQANQIPFVGTIPYDPTASRVINEGRSLGELDCPASHALKQVYENTLRLLCL